MEGDAPASTELCLLSTNRDVGDRERFTPLGLLSFSALPPPRCTDCSGFGVGGQGGWPGEMSLLRRYLSYFYYGFFTMELLSAVLRHFQSTLTFPLDLYIYFGGWFQVLLVYQTISPVRYAGCFQKLHHKKSRN